MPGSRRLAFALAACLCVGAGFAPAVHAQANGVLGIYFDDRASNCSNTFAVGTSRTLYVLLLAEGDTRGGVSGLEFSIDASAATGYNFSGETVTLPNGFGVGGPAVGDGLNIVSTRGCESRLPLPVMRLQVTNLSGSRDGVVEIAAKSPPSNYNFACPLVTLCDSPAFTKVCIAPDRAVLNPSGALRCGVASEKSDWGRVKELYR